VTITNEGIFKKLEKRIDKLPVVKITDKILFECYGWAETAVKAKMKEDQWKKDGGKAVRRLATGKTGEKAVEKLLGMKFSDDTIGHSRLFWQPDLKCLGFNCGIKTVNWGLAPMVSKHPRSSELFVILRDTEGNCEAIIVGVATKAVIEKFSDDSLVLDKRAVFKRNGKTGFYGFEKCKLVTNLDTLKGHLSE